VARSAVNRGCLGRVWSDASGVHVAVTACDSSSKICFGTTLGLVWQYACCEVYEME
jgi:hypothetical protein